MVVCFQRTDQDINEEEHHEDHVSSIEVGDLVSPEGLTETNQQSYLEQIIDYYNEVDDIPYYYRSRFWIEHWETLVDLDYSPQNTVVFFESNVLCIYKSKDSSRTVSTIFLVSTFLGLRDAGDA